MRAQEAAAEHTREDALQGFIGRISDMVITGALQAYWSRLPGEGIKKGEKEASKAAKAQIILLLRRLSGDTLRQNLALAFLADLGLVNQDDPTLDFEGANLSGISLVKVVFPVGLNLEKADFSNSNCEGTRFPLARLKGAQLNDMILKDADLSSAIGLKLDQMRASKTWEGAHLPLYLQEQLVN
jgi:hypothetical protein